MAVVLGTRLGGVQALPTEAEGQVGPPFEHGISVSRFLLKLTYCKPLWIKASAKCPECKYEYNSCQKKNVMRSSLGTKQKTQRVHELVCNKKVVFLEEADWQAN